MGKTILQALLFLLFAISSAETANFTLEQKFAHANAGDFIVTAQEGNYSLLFIHSITTDKLILEEISIPEHLIDLKKIDWKKWVAGKAPGHTSWTLYEIDRNSGKLIECFSHSKNGWLYLDESEQFLTRLLTLQLHTVPEKERKKIGPPPTQNEEDRRALWNPPLIIDGHKTPKPSFDVLKTEWPDDGSRLSRCFIELYFTKEDPDFPFPYWLEVQSSHYTFKMRTIDSGHHLTSPLFGPMPHRSPQILGMVRKGVEHWTLSIKTPVYAQKLHLFARDLYSQPKTTTPVPFFAQKGAGREEMILEIAIADLSKILKEEHRYQWILIPEGGPDIYVESEEIFTWQP
ncbi:MAG: hypothetical protein WA347_00715 [Rhabdochlamydiaceae bacterium]